MEQRDTARLRARPEHKTSPLSPTVSIVLSFFFFILSGLLVVNMVKSISTAYQRNQLLSQAESEVDGLRMRNLALLEKLDYVSSDAYVEQEARNQLQYAKDGETMVLLPDTGEREETKSDVEDNDSGTNVTDVTDDGETVLGAHSSATGEGWERWWNLVCNGV